MGNICATDATSISVADTFVGPPTFSTICNISFFLGQVSSISTRPRLDWCSISTISRTTLVCHQPCPPSVQQLYRFWIHFTSSNGHWPLCADPAWIAFPYIRITQRYPRQGNSNSTSLHMHSLTCSHLSLLQGSLWVHGGFCGPDWCAFTGECADQEVLLEVSELAKFICHADKLSSPQQAAVTFESRIFSVKLAPKSLLAEFHPGTLILDLVCNMYNYMVFSYKLLIIVSMQSTSAHLNIIDCLSPHYLEIVDYSAIISR